MSKLTTMVVDQDGTVVNIRQVGVVHPTFVRWEPTEFWFLLGVAGVSSLIHVGPFFTQAESDDVRQQIIDSLQ